MEFNSMTMKLAQYELKIWYLCESSKAKKKIKKTAEAKGIQREKGEKEGFCPHRLWWNQMESNIPSLMSVRNITNAYCVHFDNSIFILSFLYHRP